MPGKSKQPAEDGNGSGSGAGGSGKMNKATPGDSVSKRSFRIRLSAEDADSDDFEFPFTRRSGKQRRETVVDRFHSDDHGASSNKLGTVNGVLLPCIQNIFGVIMFIRLAWIVGTAGWLHTVGIVLLCASATFLTAVSLSAIATNGLIPAGGPYYVISRGLGPQVGGAVGVLFFLGNTISGAMYVVGAVELFIVYLLPEASIFGDADSQPAAKVNATRLYGTILLFIVAVIVFIGMKYVVRTAIPIFLCVVVSILSIYVGLAVGHRGSAQFDVCVVGSRLVSREFAAADCSPTNPRLRAYFCNDVGGEEVCDGYFQRAADSGNPRSGIRVVSAVTPSLRDGLLENMHPKRAENVRDFVTTNSERTEFVNYGNDPGNAFVQIDMLAEFAVLVGIFFPSVTGMLAGCNRSGDLSDPSRSIPIGTLTAIVLTTSVYLSLVFMFAAYVRSFLLNDKFGRALGSQLLVSMLAWPNRWVLLVGALASTVGAALQSLVGAPKLLAAIAQDNTIPYLYKIKPKHPDSPPRKALLVTWLLCQVTVLIGSVDDITPLLSAFFLMCYLSINLSCALQGLLRNPNWRPRLRFYHWSISVLGAVVCFAVMVISSWMYTIVAFLLALAIIKGIDFHGSTVEWGHGLRGLNVTSAQKTLLNEEGKPVYPKNWRPAVLVLIDAEAPGRAQVLPPLFDLIRALKHMSGVAMVGCVIPADPQDAKSEIEETTTMLRAVMYSVKLKGFVRVVASLHPSEACSVMVQSVGVATLSPNTIAVCMPTNHLYSSRFWPAYCSAIRSAIACGKAVMVIKGVDTIPDLEATTVRDKRERPTIDIWWIFTDGGMLLLLPYLLRQSKEWNLCHIRIFTVARPQDNSIAMRKNLEQFIYQLRIPAQVEVVEIPEADLAAYSVERTMALEQRKQLLREMQLAKEEQEWDVVSLLDESRLEEYSPDAMIEGAGAIPGTTRLSPSPDPRTFSQTIMVGGRLQLMHTARTLNAMMLKKSRDCRILFVNLPSGPKYDTPPDSYLRMLEALTADFPRAVLVYGSGSEVVTVYS